MKARIEQEIASLPDNFIVGLVVKSASYEEANMHVLNILMQKYGHLGSYVTINKPYAHITEQLKGKNIQTDNLFFIDCITKNIGAKAPKANNCVFLESPSSLTNIAIALHEYVIATKNHKRF